MRFRSYNCDTNNIIKNDTSVTLYPWQLTNRQFIDNKLTKKIKQTFISVAEVAQGGGTSTVQSRIVYRFIILQ